MPDIDYTTLVPAIPYTAASLNSRYNAVEDGINDMLAYMPEEKAFTNVHLPSLVDVSNFAGGAADLHLEHNVTSVAASKYVTVCGAIGGGALPGANWVTVDATAAGGPNFDISFTAVTPGAGTITAFLVLANAHVLSLLGSVESCYFAIEIQGTALPATILDKSVRELGSQVKSDIDSLYYADVALRTLITTTETGGANITNIRLKANRQTNGSVQLLHTNLTVIPIYGELV